MFFMVNPRNSLIGNRGLPKTRHSSSTQLSFSVDSYPLRLRELLNNIILGLRLT